MKRTPILLAGAFALLLALPRVAAAELPGDEFSTLVKRDWGDAVIRVNLEHPGPVTFALESGEVSGLNHAARQQANFRIKGRKKTVLRGPEDAVSTVTGQAPKLLPRSVPALAAAGDGEAGAAATGTGPAWIPIGPAPIPNGQTSPADENGISLTQSPVSGRTVAIRVHPTNPNIAYVGTAQGGLYRTLDGGANWTPLLDQAATLAVGSVELDPSDPSRVIVGTGEGVFSGDSFAGVGLYVITGADSANPVLNGPYNQDALGNDVFTRRCAKGLAISPDGNTAFVGTVTGVQGKTAFVPAAGVPRRGLFRSTNFKSGAPTFEKLNVMNEVAPADYRITAAVLEPGNPNNLIVGLADPTGAAPQGLYRSTNALAPVPTFTKVLDTADGSFAPIRLAINKNPINNVVTVVAATGNANPDSGIDSTNQGKIFVSTDAGASFVEKPAGRGFAGPQGFYNLGVAIHPTDGNIFYAVGTVGRSAQAGTIDIGDNGTFIFTRDGGVTFQASTRTLHVDSHAVAVAPSKPEVVYTGNDGGIWRSDDAGANFTNLNTASFSTTQFVGLSVHPTDRNFTIGGTQDNGTEFRMPDGTWRRADFGDGGFTAIDQNAKNTQDVTMYHTYFNAQAALVGFARVLRSDCAIEGQWAFRGFFAGTVPGALPVPIPELQGVVCDGSLNPTANGLSPADFVNFYAPMALGPGNPNTLYFGTDRLYRSNNRGETMVQVSEPLSPAGAAGFSPVSSIGISAQDDNFRLVGTNNGGVFATTVGGPLLPVRNAMMPATPVERAVIDPTNKNIAYVTFGGYGTTTAPIAANAHIWKTTNLNAALPTWTPSGNGLPDEAVNGFAVDPQNNQHLYAGTDRGVFVSTDGGANWAAYGTGLPNVSVWDVAVQNSGRLLRIATHGRGMWEIPLVLGGEQLPLNRLQNLSTRARVSTGDRVLIGGFIITGSAQKRVIVRGIGPSSAGNGIPSDQTLQDPILELRNPDGVLITTNDNWRDSQEAEIQQSGLAPQNENESAIIRNLDPGRYTAILYGKGDTSGIGLVESFDLGASGDPRLANIATRGFVETGDNVLIGGFIIGGGTAPGSSTIVARVIGPSLSNSGVPDALQDPTVELFNANGASIAFNNNWKESQQADIERSQLAPSDDREAALLQVLPNGVYTAIARGVNDTTGTALVELYNVL